jgi:hypothetical protein
MPTGTARACIVGAFEHPTRKAPDKTVAQLHAECAAGALRDAGLGLGDVDGYFCAGDAPGMGPTSMIDFMHLRVRHTESTDVGGTSYISAVAHARDAIAAGRCNVALITLAGRPRRCRCLHRPETSFRRLPVGRAQPVARDVACFITWQGGIEDHAARHFGLRDALAQPTLHLFGREVSVVDLHRGEQDHTVFVARNIEHGAVGNPRHRAQRCLHRASCHGCPPMRIRSLIGTKRWPSKRRICNILIRR